MCPRQDLYKKEHTDFIMFTDPTYISEANSVLGCRLIQVSSLWWFNHKPNSLVGWIWKGSSPRTSVHSSCGMQTVKGLVLSVIKDCRYGRKARDDCSDNAVIPNVYENKSYHQRRVLFFPILPNILQDVLPISTWLTKQNLCVNSYSKNYKFLWKFKIQYCV
jgi:hypothetical protein